MQDTGHGWLPPVPSDLASHLGCPSQDEPGALAAQCGSGPSPEHMSQATGLGRDSNTIARETRTEKRYSALTCMGKRNYREERNLKGRGDLSERVSDHEHWPQSGRTVPEGNRGPWILLGSCVLSRILDVKRTAFHTTCS